MAYVRYIKKKSGTLVGPYLYMSVRKGNKVVGKFMRKLKPEELKKFKNKNKKMDSKNGNRRIY